MRSTFLSVLALFCMFPVMAQTVNGSWYGRADVMISGNASNYLTEFVLKQKGSDVEGLFGYYFKDSYQSFFVRGTYNNRTRQLVIKNLPLLFYASPTRTGIECPMYFQGTLMVSKAGSTLQGAFYTEEKYRYTCPQLSVRLMMDANDKSQDSLMRTAKNGRKFWQPQDEDFVVTGYSVKTDTTPSINYSTAIISASQPVIQEQQPNKDLIAAFGKRNNIYEKDIWITQDSVLVSFYDNGDIDDDTISVFLNKKPILASRGLSSRALNIYIGLDSSIEINELSMFADNLGKFPPNTALMVISDGEKRYELYLSASLKQNASVRLKRLRRNP